MNTRPFTSTIPGKLLAFAPCLALGILLTGCFPTASLAPLGAKPTKFKEGELGKAYRTTKGDPVQVRVIDSERGELEIVVPEEGKKEAEQPRYRVLVRTQDEAVLYNLLDPENPTPPRYRIGRLLMHDNAILIWWVTEDAVRKLVKEGVLRAEFPSKGDVDAIVTDGYGALAKKLAGPEGWLLLDMEHPLVWVKVE
ncbi:MAG: hypothetical protein FJ405_09990 [Verrucomicrobia bacterium]|nr:hypothetical protein [Verrucomicrobiota bacterium]